jgi:Ran GTPase-activating protein (RanGAP) involved in mRNA processing and transport
VVYVCIPAIRFILLIVCLLLFCFCRGDSANTLGQAVATNNHLMVLNLAYNAIGDSGAQQLAHSLRFNASLTTLDVSFNHLGPKTSLVFSQVLDSTDVLTS